MVLFYVTKINLVELDLLIEYILWVIFFHLKEIPDFLVPQNEIKLVCPGGVLKKVRRNIFLCLCFYGEQKVISYVFNLLILWWQMCLKYGGNGSTRGSWKMMSSFCDRFFWESKKWHSHLWRYWVKSRPNWKFPLFQWILQGFLVCIDWCKVEKVPQGLSPEK